MEPKIYTIFIVIVQNINFSVSSVLYERFKSERKEIQMRDQQPFEDENEEKKEEEGQRSNSNRERGFLNDLLWMLEYNNNGFMQLIICFVHILLLASQVITSFLYISLPTEQDPITKEFINPVLRYAEYLSFIDFIHKFDSDGRYNLLIGLSTLQFLVLRSRALIKRFKQANANRYTYKKLNIIEFDVGYANEARYTQLNAIRALWKAFKHHECPEDISLTGESRRATLEFNKMVRGLSKIDRIYYYNQIDFNKCWREFLAFDDYLEQIEQIDHKRSNEKVSSLKVGEKTKQFSWLTYLFCVNLPNRISYVARPEHRIHIKPGVVLTYSLYFSSIIALITATPCLCILSTLTSIKYQNWSRYSWFGCIFGILKTNLTVMFVCANIYDNALLAFCSILLSSRSRRVVKLLKDEIKFYQVHLKKLSKIYIQYTEYLESFRNGFARLPITTTGLPRKSREDSQFDYFIKNGYENSTCSESNLLSLKQQQQQQQQLNKFSEFSFIRRQQTCYNALSKIYHHSFSDQDPLFELILDYRENLSREKIFDFNENISYLLDLVEVIQMEFNDHKRFFTFTLDVNVIFGTLGCSVTLSILFSSADSKSIFFIILGVLLCFVAMICSLIIGATGEASFINLYRYLRVFLADQLGFIEKNNYDRLLKICENLVHIENRSIVLLGSFPLSFGSLTSILVWMATCTFMFVHFLL